MFLINDSHFKSGKAAPALFEMVQGHADRLSKSLWKIQKLLPLIG
jgi:hypothetical protein